MGGLGLVNSQVRSLKILIAEDNETNQMMATMLLEGLGHSVEVAVDGEQAVNTWEAGDFDLILMDVQMPNLDGLAATNMIRAMESMLGGTRIPIIALTGRSEAGDEQLCLDSGMDAYLKKPLEEDALLEKLTQLIAS